MKKSELKEIIREILTEAEDNQKIFDHFKDFIITLLQEEGEDQAITLIEESEDNHAIKNILEEDTNLDFIDILDDFMSNPRNYK